ncbi:MAG: S41 family peptidase [Clostridia bacterium]|nr:S41 family peptidase [Clostridia bacterium]
MNENNPKKTTEKVLKIIGYLVLVVAVGFYGYFVGVLQERSSSPAGNPNTQALKIQKINDLIHQNYYFQDNIDDELAFDYAMAGYVAHLGDPFSFYIPSSDLESFNTEVEGNYVGIGVEVTVDDSNFIVVMNSFDGSAAQKAGIKTGDRIIKVEDTPVTGDKLNEAVNMIRGPVGETVYLEILTKDGETKQLELVRSEVSVETVRVQMLNDGIGYVRISSFDVGTDAEFIRKFEELDSSELKGLVVDLRSNSGGTLDSVVAVSDYLMPEGTIVSVKYTDGSESVYESDGEHQLKVPVCVLIDEGTASAAELLAGALRDNNGAKLIGQNSYGKGVVGQSFAIDSKSALLLTIGEYFLPCGENIHGVGLKPDIEVAIENQTMSVFMMEQSEDTQLQRAIEELKAYE